MTTPQTQRAQRPLRERARDIVRLLGTEDWHVSNETFEDTYREVVKLLGPADQGILLYIKDDTPTRIYITGIYARDQEYGSYLHCEEDFHVTVGRNRPVTTIAKEITRRFLPRYQELYHTTKKRQREYQAMLLEEQRLMDSLAPLVDARTGHKPTVAYATIQDIDIRITTGCGHCGLLLQHIPEATAKTILAIIRNIDSQ